MRILFLQGCGGVDISYPAFGFIRFFALLGGGDQRIGIERRGTLQVQVLLESVSLEADVHG